MKPARRHGRARAAALGLASIVAGGILSGTAMAQQQDDGPIVRLGISTGVLFNDNRGLDASSLGSTTELPTRLDFAFRFATPVQQLDFSGDIGLRSVSGAESGNLSSGFYNPNLALGYARQSRDAQLDVNLFARQSDVSSSLLQLIEETGDFALLNDTGSLLRFGFDSTLELRRRAPFGVTLSAGFTGLRYSDTTSATLTDQDRFRIGAGFRLDLDPATRATVDARLSTFEDDGTVEGRRDTYTLDGRLVRTLRNGSATVRAIATSTEDGPRYTLSVGRTIETELWDISGAFGVTRGIDGDVSATGNVDVTRTLKNGTWSANLSRSVISGNDDDEQQVTTLGLGYTTQLNALTVFSTDLSYTDRSTTGAGNDGSFGVLGVSLQRDLSEDWGLNVGLQHRVTENSAGVRARDNQLTLTLRRDLVARR